MDLTNVEKKLDNKIDESKPQLRKELSKQINKIYAESLEFLLQIQGKYNDSFDQQQRYIILYYLNSVMIAQDIALLQKQDYNQNSSVMIAARSIFEGCSSSLRLIKEYSKSKYSEFFKYLVIHDLYQDLIIYNGWDELNLDYLNRFHKSISEYFPDYLENTNLSKYVCRVTNYSRNNIVEIKSIVKKLYKNYKYKYKKSDLCKELFSDNNLIEDEHKVDVSIIYPMNCHFSHLNLSGIDDMCCVTIDDKNYITLNNNHYQLLPTIQWVVYSLKYLFAEVKKFIE